MEWQPIETAPMDGTRVLVFRMCWQESAAVCWFNRDTDEWIPVGGVMFCEPTHWMPLPPAPAASASAPTTGSRR